MQEDEYKVLFEQEESFWWYRALHRLVEERLGEIIRSAGGNAASPSAPSRPLEILDAGCGTGGMLTRLGRYGRARGIDWSPYALGYARRRGRSPLARASVTRLPFRSGSFDVVVSLDVLYHRAVESDLEALKEFRRVLRPEGRLILNLPAFESLRSSHDAAIHTARRYTRGRLEQLLIEAGFVPLRLTFWNSLLFPGLALVRRFRRRTEKGGPSGPEAERSDVRPLPRWLDRTLYALLRLEAFCLRRFDPPCGLSLMAVARPAKRP